MIAVVEIVVVIIIIIIIIIIIKGHDRVCAQLHFNICKETGVQLDKKHWYEHVPKSVETGQGGNVTIRGINKFKLTEPFLTTNQTL